MSDPVQDQYEAYPYPARDPREEAGRLIAGSPSHLDEINHYLFAGRRDFAAPFRALVAGGGTGDATIMLAQQLADAGDAGAVVYLDLSAASRRIAEDRAQARGLTNITFLSGSLLDLPARGLADFDYIDCCGVLHHLADADAGLAALTKLLKADGGMGLMLYGPYGRRGVYETQALLRDLGGDLPLTERVAQTRRLMTALPASNWLRRNPFLGDHRRSDAELVDLLLHPQDRAFTVEEIGALVAGAGLKLVSFLPAARYDPATYLKDPQLLKPLAAAPPLRRAAAAEKLAGNFKTHVFYVSRSEAETQARPDNTDKIPVLRDLEGAALAKALQKDLTLKVDLEGLPLRFALPRLAPVILQRIDGATSLGQIHQALQALDSSLDWTAFKKQFDALYGVLNGLNHLLLRQPASSR